MPKPAVDPRRYVPGFDGIRAVAVLGVIAYHLDLGWASGGLLGVGVFFVLSGYLITDLLVSEFRSAGRVDLIGFWRRRARRLLPALFLMLFLVVGWATLFAAPQLGQLRSDLPSAVAYYSNWWFIYDHVSYFAQFGPPSPLGHLWSLAIEEQFYLCWPLLLLLGLRYVRSSKARIAIVLALAAGSAVEMGLFYTPLANPTRVYDGTDTRAFALLIGAALALAWPRDSRTTRVTPGARRILEVAGGGALVGILVLFSLTSEYATFLYRGGMVLAAVLSAVLIVVTAHKGARIGRLLGARPLRWIGERSYGLYLWSYPVIVLTTPLNRSPGTLRAAIDIAATFVLAALSWRYVEEPVRHGALGRFRARVRDRRWALPRLGRRGWAATSLVAANCVLCTVGLTGVVASPPYEPQFPVESIVPTVGHGAAPRPVSPSVGQRGIRIEETATTLPSPAGAGVTAIGDSVMIDAAPYLRQMLPGISIDAVVGQQFYQVYAAIPKLKAEGAIGDKVIIELGTNGPFSAQQLISLLHRLGPMRRIVIVNTCEPRSWSAYVNQAIAQVARTYPGVTVVDWNAIGHAHPSFFYPDDVHLLPNGARFYAGLLVSALRAPSPGTTASTHFRR